MNTKDAVLRALADYGTQEIAGTQNNNKIVDYFKKAGFSWVTDDETAWCAAFLNAILVEYQLPNTGKLNAKSFLELGIETQEPEIGDIVVLWRISKSSPFGHAGFFIAKDNNNVYILGGNQNNEVDISKFPLSRVLGFRKLSVEI